MSKQTGLLRNRVGARTYVVRHRKLKLENLESRQMLAADLMSEYSSDRLLVQFEQPPAYDSILAGTKIGDEIGFGIRSIEVDESVVISEAVDYYRSLDYVEFAQPDYRVSIEATANDPFFNQLWGLHNTGQSGGTPDADIDVLEAWDTTVGSNDVVVAVIDTGIDWTHPDLAANIWTNSGEIPNNNLDDDGNGFVDDFRGWDFANGDNNPADDNGHGTHVAGTIGAVGNNGVGITGVAQNVKLMPLKFLRSDGSGFLSDAISSIDYAVENGADILNNSWGGGGFSSALSAAIDRSRAEGALFVAAAGNSNNNNDVRPSYPASYSQDNIISVAASDRNDNRASFSNYGRASVDIAAPGVSIVSTLPNNRYGSLSGTSMAAPHVSGAAALVWAANPSFTYSEVKAALLNNADLVSQLSNFVSAGRLNAANAVNATPPSDDGGAKVTDAQWSGPGNSLSSVRVSFDESIDVATFDASDVSLSGPNGGISVLGIQPVGGSDTEFDISFANQSTVGNYTLTIGPDILDTAGNPLNQDGDGTNGEAFDDVFTTVTSLQDSFEVSWSGLARLRDAFWIWAGAIDLRLNVPQEATIGDLNVTVDVLHTWDSDLRLILFGPDGTQVRLFDRRGGSGDNIFATFDDEADTLVRNGQAPFSGSFRPEQPLSAFDGRSTAGQWTLRILDYAGGDTGYLRGVTLSITPDGSAGSAEATSLSSVGVVHPPCGPNVSDDLTLDALTSDERGTALSEVLEVINDRRQPTIDLVRPVTPLDSAADSRQVDVARIVDEFWNSLSESELDVADDFGMLDDTDIRSPVRGGDS